MKAFHLHSNRQRLTAHMDRRLVVRLDVDRDDRHRLSQGNRLSALREGPRLVRRAEEGSALPLPSHP